MTFVQGVVIFLLIYGGGLDVVRVANLGGTPPWVAFRTLGAIIFYVLLTTFLNIGGFFF